MASNNLDCPLIRGNEVAYRSPNTVAETNATKKTFRVDVRCNERPGARADHDVYRGSLGIDIQLAERLGARDRADVYRGRRASRFSWPKASVPLTGPDVYPGSRLGWAGEVA